MDHMKKNALNRTLKYNRRQDVEKVGHVLSYNLFQNLTLPISSLILD